MSDEELVEALRRTLAADADAAEVVAVPDVGDVVVRRQRRERRRLITLGVVAIVALLGTGVVLSQMGRSPARVVDVPSGPGPSRSSDVAGPGRVHRQIGTDSAFDVTVGEPTPTRIGNVCTAAWRLDATVVVGGEAVGDVDLVVPLAPRGGFATNAIFFGSAPGGPVPSDETNRAVVLGVSAPSGRSVTADFADGRSVTVDVDADLALLGAAQEGSLAAGAADPLVITRLTVRTTSGAEVELTGGPSPFNGVFGADGRSTGQGPAESAVGCAGK